MMNQLTTTDVLVFEVGGQRFGLVSATVQELVRAVSIVRLPKAPAIVEGVIQYRGTVIPVLDIRARFRLTAKPLEVSDHFVIAWAERRLVALRVDRALDILQVSSDQVQEAAGMLPGVEYVAWLAKTPEDLILIHDLSTFLSRAESCALDQALASEKPSEGVGG